MTVAIEVLWGTLIALGALGFQAGLLSWRQHARIRNIWGWLRTTYTMRRWATQSFIVCGVGLMWQASIWQLTLGDTQIAMIGELGTQSHQPLSIATLVGTSITFHGLHLRDWEQSLWLEVAGYLATDWALVIWIVLVYTTIPLPNTSYGLNLTEGFAIANSIRLFWVLRYKWATHHHSEKQFRLRRIIGGGAEYTGLFWLGE